MTGSPNHTTDEALGAWSDLEKYLAASLHVVLSLFILIGNGMTILAIRRTSQLQTQANVYVMHLALADILCGVSLLTSSAMILSQNAFNQHVILCLAFHIIGFVSAGQSLLTLAVMAFDGLVHVLYPLRYVRFLTERVTRRILLCSWVVSLASNTVTVYLNDFESAGGCYPFHVVDRAIDGIYHPIIILSVTTFTTTCYTIIACTARKHRSNLKTSLAQPTTQQGPQSDASTDNSLELRRHRGGGHAKRYKSVTLFVIVNTVFSICWIPYVVLGLVAHFTPIPERASRLVIFLAMSNSGMNFIILACRNRQFSTAYRNLISTCFCRREP